MIRCLKHSKRKKGVKDKHQKMNDVFMVTIYGLNEGQYHNGDTVHLKEKFPIKLKPLVAWFLLGKKFHGMLPKKRLQGTISTMNNGSSAEWDMSELIVLLQKRKSQWVCPYNSMLL
jgi:hypothetical protein